jgi:hypothetical protein
MISGAPFTPSKVRADEWEGAYNILYLWFMPGRIGEPERSVVMILICLLLLLAILALGKWTGSGEASLVGRARPGAIAMSLGLIYAGVLLASRLYLRPFPLDDGRQLLPLLPVLILGFASVGTNSLAAQDLGFAPSRRGGISRKLLLVVRVILVGYAMLMLGSYARHSAQWLAVSLSKGLGYSNDSWRSSRIVEAVRSIPPETPLFSNAYDALYLLTGKEIRPLPDRLPAGALSPPPDLPSDWRQMEGVLRDQGGLIAYFNRATRGGMADEGDLTAVMHLCPEVAAEEGTIYRLCD